MNNELENQRRNKRIIAIICIIVALVVFIIIITTCQLNNQLSFRYIHNNNTSEQLSILVSIFLYILILGVAGLVPYGALALLSMIVYFFLHRKDERILERRYHPPYESEFFFGEFVARITAYIGTFIMLVLYISGLITFRIF